MTELTPLLAPQSIAVVGASANPAKLGHVLLKNIVEYRFAGEIFPVNSQGEEVLGIHAYRSIAELPHPVDLAVISIPGKFVLSSIEECAGLGVKAVIILSSGFGEMGGEGSACQARIKEIARSTGMRIVGPNCMGIYNISHHCNATYFWQLPRKEGRLSFISQSGAYGGIFFHEIKKRDLAITKFISIGNMVDIDHADVLEYLKKDRETEIIALFIEEIKDGPKFIRAVRDIGKPVIALKVGKTRAGKRAALSHTGSMAGSYEAFKTMGAQFGITVAESSDEFFDAIKAFLSNNGILPRSFSTAIMTISGGPSVVASDACELSGMEVPELDAKTRAEIAPLLPEFAALSNPVDMTPQINPKNYGAVVDRVLANDYLGSCIAINCGLDSREFANAFVAASQKYRKPVHAFSIDNAAIEGIFKNNDIPIFPTPERCVTALKKLADYHSFQEKPAPRAVDCPRPSAILKQLAQSGRKVIDELSAKNILGEYGIPVVEERAGSDAAQIVEYAREIGYPVVLKVLSQEVLHKTEMGGVITGIAGEGQLRLATDNLQKKFPGARLLVQKMISHAMEVILGIQKDPVFGHLVLFGIGGIHTEIYRDVSMRICPIDVDTAGQMIREIKGVRLLQGYRGLPPVDLSRLAGHISLLSYLVYGNPEIKELDINPLMIDAGGEYAVDALMVLEA